MALDFTQLGAAVYVDTVDVDKEPVRVWMLEVEAALATICLYLTGVAGTNTITADSDPEIISYRAGQKFLLVPANTISGAATLNINGLGAKNIVRPDGVAVGAGELIANRLTPLVYDGTSMRLEHWPELEGSTTYDPGSLIDAAGATTTLTVTGAALGDFVDVSFSTALAGITVTGWVSASNTVSVRFQNESAGTLDLTSGTLRARVRKPWA